ncbi:MAG: SusC/RagA family TonB-linked outer membrane protein, partial [Bacteroidetes bacterium]|nr:SusC/RagA family TonB-linked outer membrane protein [Bacteroidota bacterium]
MKHYLPLILLLIGFAMTPLQGQTQTVSGTVTDSQNGEALPGVAIRVKGTARGAVTDLNGAYTVEAAGTDVLVFSFVGYVDNEVPINNRTSINVQLSPDEETLSEVVVTGYTTQRREDITGAVSIVNTEELMATPAGNVQQQLQGRVSGVTTSGSGEPGAGAKVRIRGFGTLGNNDPLYIIDGVPTQNVGNINPNDVESMQVLKDASSASIYGSRAANGVVIITTKKGKVGVPRITLDSYYGTQIAPRGPELLNTQQLGDLLWQSARNAGQDPQNAQYGNGAEPQIPDFILAGDQSGVMEGDPATNPELYNIDFSRPRHQIVRANKEGTDWWDEVFDPAPIQNHQLTISGGTEASQYNVGFNYFNQEGIAKYTGYDRFALRANTQFTVKDRLRIGENLQVSYNQSNTTPGGQGGGENAILQIYRMQPIVPVYDIMGNFAGTAGTNLGNASNPVADLFRARNNQNNATRLFGNIFAELDIVKNFTARTSFGVDYETRYGQFFQQRTYERSENINTNSLTERNDFDQDWTWTNTFVYKNQFGDMHDLTVLAGTEAVKNTGRGVGGRRLNFFSEDPNFWVLDRGDPVGQNNFSYINVSTLYSLFGRVDYTLANKYLINATLRRDGSSRFGSEVRYGTFPAFSLGWRVSEEGFMQDIGFLDDLKVRGGWGKMGNQLNVDLANPYSFYRSTPGASSYDIGGTNNAVVAGFDLDRLGNP